MTGAGGDGQLGAAFKQLPDETHHIGLDLLVKLTLDELRHPAGAKAIVIKEVLLQDAQRLSCLEILQQRLQSGRNIGGTASVVSYNVIQVVCVLVLSTLPKGKSLQNDVSPRPTNPYRPSCLFSYDGSS